MVVCGKCGIKYPADAGYFYQRKDGSYIRPCKSCVKAKSSARYADKANSINFRRAYRMANDPEYRKKKLASDSASYSKHKIKRLEQQKIYRSREDVRLRLQKYFRSLRDRPGFIESKKRYLRLYHAASILDQDVLEQKRELGRLWAKNNPEKMKAATRNRRARLRNSTGKHTADDVLAQIERQGGRCFWCDCDVVGNHTVDHYVPIAKGGSNGPENIVIACPSCNYRKQDKLPEEFVRYLREVSMSTNHSIF